MVCICALKGIHRSLPALGITAAPAACRARIRRKPSDEVLDEQLMQEVAITGARPTLKGRGELPSPEARATLDSIYGSMDDPTNK